MASLVLSEIFRDIKRRKFQIVAIILTMGIGLSMLSIVGNLSASMDATLYDIERKYNESSMYIWTKDRLFSSDTIEAIKELDGVGLVEGKLSLFGSSIISGEFVRTRLYGTNSNPQINTIIVENETVWTLFKGNVCIVDRYMAQQVNLSVGEEIEVFTIRGKIRLKVLAIADAEWSISLSRPITVYLFTPLETVQSMYGERGYSEILVKVRDGYEVETVYDSVVKLLKNRGYSVDGWYRIHGSSYTAGIEAVFSVLFIPALLIAGLLLVTVLLNKIITEYRSFGIRKALGFTPRDISKMVIYYALVLYGLSIPISFAFSWGITYALMNLMMGRWLPNIKYTVNMSSFYNSVILGFVIVLLFVIYPSRKAGKINALEAIRWGFETPKFKQRNSERVLPLRLAFAIRNITRRKKKSAIIFLSLILGASTYMSISTVSDSIIGTYNSALDGEKYDALISYVKPVGINVTNSLTNIEGVRSVEGYFYWYLNPRNLVFKVNGEAIDNKPRYSYPLIRFVHPSDRLYQPEIVAGGWIKNHHDLVISYTVSNVLNVRVGDNLTVIYRYSKGELKLNFTIVGISKSIWQNGWDFTASIEYAYEVGLIQDETVKVLAVKVKDGYSVESVVKNILSETSEYGPSTVFILKYMYKGLADITETISTFMITIIICTLAVLLIGITVSFLISTMERRWEIGVMKAIGFTDRDIFKVLLAESSILALLSIIPSLFLGSILANFFVNMISRSGFFVVIYPYTSIMTFGTVILLPLVISIISIIPAFVIAKRVKTADLLRKTF